MESNVYIVSWTKSVYLHKKNTWELCKLNIFYDFLLDETQLFN